MGTSFPGGRAQLRRNHEGLYIAIPAVRQWGAMVFISVWLAAWAVGWYMGATMLGGGSLDGPPALFMLFWLSIWTIGGLAAAWQLAYFWVGREVIKVNSRQLTLAKVLGRWEYGRRVFALPEVREMGLTPSAQELLRLWATTGQAKAAATTPGNDVRLRIRFAHRGQLVQCGSDLSDEEATWLIARIEAAAGQTLRGGGG